jgi:phosphatidylserine decarboxylase
MSAATIGERLFIALQHLLPQHPLSRLIGSLARSRQPLIRRPLLAFFLRVYRPDLSDAEQVDASAFASFNDFFTRALRAGARPGPAAPAAIASPVDGRISALGTTEAGRVLQAKGQDYALGALLAGDARLGTLVQGGPFMTIYLAPYNYHRIHMPLAGRLRGAGYVPGRLFSVNDATARLVPGLFARNERLVLEFTGECGPFIVILVGALFVGSMGTVWHGDIAPPRSQAPVPLPLPEGTAATLERGAELGRFNMGSTVILLLPRGAGSWAGVGPGQALRVGQAIGTIATSSTVTAVAGD